MRTGKRGEASNLRGKKRQPAQGLTECYTRLYRCGDQQTKYHMRRIRKWHLSNAPNAGKNTQKRQLHVQTAERQTIY